MRLLIRCRWRRLRLRPDAASALILILTTTRRAIRFLIRPLVERREKVQKRTGLMRIFRRERERSVEGDVTLFVYGWYSVAPGPLSWSFSSTRSALDAVQKMKNAVGWCIVAGKGHPSVE